MKLYLIKTEYPRVRSCKDFCICLIMRSGCLPWLQEAELDAYMGTWAGDCSSLCNAPFRITIYECLHLWVRRLAKIQWRKILAFPPQTDRMSHSSGFFICLFLRVPLLRQYSCCQIVYSCCSFMVLNADVEKRPPSTHAWYLLKLDFAVTPFSWSLKMVLCELICSQGPA